MSDKKRRCHMTAVAIEQNDLPADWIWCSASASEQPEDFTRLRGAVYDVFTRGPRKGRPNYRKPKPGTERTVFVRQRDIKAWEKLQEELTGDCMKCDGTGEEWSGWGRDTGHRYRTCLKCGGTGKAMKGGEA